MKKVFLKSMLLLCALIVGSLNVWADDYETVHTFTITKPASGAVSDYTKTGDMVIDGITWTVPGNWYATGALRLGGKSLSNVDRTIISQGKISSSVSKITVNHGGVTSDNMVLNSVTLTVASNSTFTENVITKTVTPSYSKNTDGSFDLSPSTPCPANRYYKIAFNLSNSNSSNYAFVLKSVVFQKPATTPHTLSSTVAPASTGTVSLGSTSIGEGNTTTIEASANTGYCFVNWTVSGEGSSVVDASAASTTFTMGTEDATVTANFAEINFWAVTYDYNDGVTDDEEVHVLKAEAASYNLKAAPSREDYSFTGWKIGATTYAAGAAYEPTANVTVQAQWEFNGTLYTYNRSNKNDLATGAKYVMGASYTSSGTTTWKYCQAMGSDTYLHAAVVGEHGSLDADDAVFFDETPEIIALNETADGWTMTNESGKKIGLKGDKQLGYDTGDQTWDLEGTDNIPTFSAQYTKSGTLTTYIMKFNWNSGNSRFNAYTSGQQDVYFYRLDDGKDVYTLTLNFKDGATDNGTHRVLEGASYTLTAPTRSGYAFNGWNTEEDGIGTPYAAGSYTMPAANTTLYAQWVATVVTPSSETDKHYATFCAPYKTKLDAGVMAYIGTYASSTLTLHVLEDSETGTVIPANTPVVLKATSADAFNVVATTDDASAVQDGTILTASNLHGTLAATAAPANAYVLGYNSAAGQETGFYQFSGTIPANRAYLIISGGAAQAAGIRIVESESNATNVENIEANDEVVKFIENGQLLIKRDGITYDALGRKIR